MRSFAACAIALTCCAVPMLAGRAPATEGQSYLYPPEVRLRPVVVVLDPILQRHYWDPRYCDLYGATAPRRRRRGNDNSR